MEYMTLGVYHRIVVVKPIVRLIRSVRRNSSLHLRAAVTAIDSLEHVLMLNKIMNQRNDSRQNLCASVAIALHLATIKNEPLTALSVRQ